MRSESLIRLDAEGTLINGGAAALRQQELDRQKAEFFAKGGRVETVEGFTVPHRPWMFNAGVLKEGTKDAKGKAIEEQAQRIEVDGRWLVVRRIAARLAARTPANIMVMIRKRGFPKPVQRNPEYWDEQEVIEWAKANPNPRRKRMHAKL